MSTRSNTFVINRQEAEIYKDGFAVNPKELCDKSYINMYLHHDGYIDYLGVEFANWVNFMQEEKGFEKFSDGSRIAAHLVSDFHYNSQYLYPNNYNIETDYTYIIWCGKSDVWISQWDNFREKCLFVGSVEKLIKKFKSDDMNYTDWSYEEYASKGY